MPMIEAENLTYSYAVHDEEGRVIGSQTAIDDISLSVKEGDFIAVLGRNGSGKSTFARHINALITPTGGTMYVGGMDTKDPSHVWDIRQKAGMVFQNPDNQIIGTVVEEDVAFGPENIGVPTEEIIRRVDSALAAVGMEARRHDSPNRLSGGQKQRVAIAGVLAIRPKCIILDESTAMLDPMGRREVLEAAKHLNEEEGMTVIWITHYMEEVVGADYVYVLHDGRLVMEGKPREIFSRAGELKKYQLDVPQVTKLADTLREEGLDLPVGILTTDELVEALCRLK